MKSRFLPEISPFEVYGVIGEFGDYWRIRGLLNTYRIARNPKNKLQALKIEKNTP